MSTNAKQLDNRYIVHKEIGSGGFGAVYLAEDTRFGGNNRVAIKKIINKNEHITKTFRQEADLLYNLTHPNLPKVTNCFQEDGASFIVMDYITGEDLYEKLKKGKKFSVEEVLQIADTVLDALEYLHSFSIFHRDIKPHNIKIDEAGKIYLLDFGTAKGSFDEETAPTQTTDQSVTGYTPFYAPLEQMLRVDANSYLLLQTTESPHLKQFLDKKTDARSDIYSLGATLYHLITGFSPEKATATIRAHAIWSGKKEPLPDCQTLNPAIPDYIAGSIKRCMEILPKDRFQTAAELRQALKNKVSKSTFENEPEKTVPITADKVPIKRPDNLEISIEQTDQIPQPVPLRTQASQPTEVVYDKPLEESIAGSVDDLFEEETLSRKPQKSKSLPFVFIGLAAIILFAIVGIAAVVVLDPFGGTGDGETTSTKNSGAENSDSGEGENSDPNSDKPTFPVNSPSRTMDYSLLVQKMRDGQKYQEPFESSGQEVFETGYQFQMRFTPSESGFLYVFNEGLNDKGEKIFNIIFPTPVRNDGKAEVDSTKQYETGWNEFSGNPGTENFWLIWSKDKNDLLEKSRDAAFTSDTGELENVELKVKLKDFLETNSKTEKEISKNFKEQYSQIKFRGDSAVHLLKLEHR